MANPRTARLSRSGSPTADKTCCPSEAKLGSPAGVDVSGIHPQAVLVPHANARVDLFAHHLIVERVAVGGPPAHVADQREVSLFLPVEDMFGGARKLFE